MKHKSYREESRANWGSSTDKALNLEQIQLGALLRIADATEKMCLDREKLERDYKYMRSHRDSLRAALDTERRRTAALRGTITKMKREKAKARGEL